MKLAIGLALREETQFPLGKFAGTNLRQLTTEFARSCELSHGLAPSGANGLFGLAQSGGLLTKLVDLFPRLREAVGNLTNLGFGKFLFGGSEEFFALVQLRLYAVEFCGLDAQPTNGDAEGNVL